MSEHNSVKFCGQCGAENSMDAAFCAKCGNPLKPKVESTPIVESTPVIPDKNEDKKIKIPDTTGTPIKQFFRKNKSVIAILAIAGVIILFILLSVILLAIVGIIGYLGNSADHFNNAVSYMNSSDYQSALSEFNRAINQDPDNSTIYLFRGLDYYCLNQSDLAFDDFNRSLELNPQYAMAYLYRGECYLDLQDYSRSLNDLNKAIQLDPQLSEAYYERAYTYESLNQYSNAINDYKTVIKNDPTWYVYFYKALDEDQLQKYSDAISDYNTSINMATQSGDWSVTPYLYDYMGNDELAIGQYNMADTYYLIAINSDPNIAAPYIDNAFERYYVKQKVSKNYKWGNEVIPWLTTAINLLSDDDSGNLTISDIQDLYRAYSLRSMAYTDAGDSSSANNDKNMADYYKKQLTSDTIPTLSGRLDIPVQTSTSPTSSGSHSSGSSGTWTSWDTQRVVTGSLIGMY